MDDFQFAEALSGRDLKRERDAGEFLHKLKTAGVADTTAQFVKSHSKEIGAALVGAAAVTGGQYLMNRPAHGRPSLEQRSARRVVESAEAVKRDAKEERRPLSFREDLQVALAPATKNTADVLARHPGKGALLAAPVGGLAGLKILKALT